MKNICKVFLFVTVSALPVFSMGETTKNFRETSISPHQSLNREEKTEKLIKKMFEFVGDGLKQAYKQYELTSKQYKKALEKSKNIIQVIYQEPLKDYFDGLGCTQLDNIYVYMSDEKLKNYHIKFAEIPEIVETFKAQAKKLKIQKPEIPNDNPLGKACIAVQNAILGSEKNENYTHNAFYLTYAHIKKKYPKEFERSKYFDALLSTYHQDMSEIIKKHQKQFDDAVLSALDSDSDSDSDSSSTGIFTYFR